MIDLIIAWMMGAIIGWLIAKVLDSNAKLKTQLTLSFKNLASDLLEEKNKKLTNHNQIQLEQLLSPFGEKIKNFEQQITRYNQENLVRNITLSTELKVMHELNSKITKEAENLTKALKGETKVQGTWGEFVLEKILENSGLEKDREYFVQSSVSDEDGKKYRPDVIINLPKGKSVIIDSKVSLVHYEKFFNTEHTTDRTRYLKQHIDSIKKHIKNLSEKNYQLKHKAQGLDFIIMFVPIEPAFSLAIKEEITLFDEAYKKNIIIVSPLNLMATLKIISNLWKQEHQNQNSLEIAVQSGALYDKFVSFIDNIKAIGRQLDLAQKAYFEAKKKLHEGKGSLISKAEKIKSLGARTSKSLETTNNNEFVV